MDGYCYISNGDNSQTRYEGSSLIQGDRVRFWIKLDRPLRAISLGRYLNDTPIMTVSHGTNTDFASAEYFSMKVYNKGDRANAAIGTIPGTVVRLFVCLV